MLNGILRKFKPITATKAEEALAEVGLDFNAIRRELTYTEPEGYTPVTCPDMVANIRGDNHKYLGSVGIGYTIVQYASMLQFTEVLVTEEKASYVCGGPLGNGEQAVIIMRTPDFIDLDVKDRIDCYFYVATSHNGTIALDVVPMPYRKMSSTVLVHQDFKGIKKVKHTKNVEKNIERAKEELVKMKEYWQNFKDSFEMLAKTPLSFKQAEGYFEVVIPGESERTKNIRNSIHTVFSHSQTCQTPNTKNTLLGAYFAVAQYQDQSGAMRTTKGRTAEDARVYSALAGGIAQKKANALGFALKLHRQMGGLTGIMRS